MGPWGSEAKLFFKHVCKSLTDSTNDPRAGAYLGQRISLAIQRVQNLMKKSHQIHKTLYINITTYKPISTKDKSYKIQKDKMNDSSSDKNNKNQNKFICSICFNKKRINDDKEIEVNNKKSKACPICQCAYGWSTDSNSSVTKNSKASSNNLIDDTRVIQNNEQTSNADVTQGLSLLNEVLKVFQTKKQLTETMERKSKTLICKDVGVATEDRIHRNQNPKLSRSKVFRYSIEAKTGNEDKFTIVYSYQPESIFATHKSLDLINHKSSSIPQMKLEELKKSLKKPTKSKDAFEEANRMFATMKRGEEKETEENRPMIRNGPRILPVVKTGNFQDNQNSIHHTNAKKETTCKHPQEPNYYMSGGDSTVKNKCHDCSTSMDRCDDCVYMMCCHHQMSRQQAKESICKCCRMAKQEG